MSPQLVGLIGVAALLILMFLRVPVVYDMLFVGLVGVFYMRGFSAGIQTSVSTLYSQFTSYSFSAVPLFIFMGYMAFHSGMLERLFDAAKKWVGHFHGGLINAGIAGGAGFGAVCGSGNASTATLAQVVVPELQKAGTDKYLIYGSVAASGILAPLIPPSVMAMLIAVVLEVSIGKVLIGGLMPGILFAILYMLYTWFKVKKNPSLAPVSPKATWGERFRSLPKMWDFFLLIFIIVGGIYLGIFSPTEAAAVSSAAILIILLLQRKFTFKILKSGLVDTLKVTCSSCVIIGSAYIFGTFLTLTKIPETLSNWIDSLQMPAIIVMLIIIAFYLVVGMFMHMMTVIYITVPILAPCVTALGYDMVWFAVMLLMVALIGALSPPFGNSLFIVNSCIEGSKIQDVYKGVIPYVLMSVIGVILCLFIPQIITFLPDLMY